MTAPHLRVRPPAVAGSFYPADPSSLRDELYRAFEAAEAPDGDRPGAKALIVPHAGYRYSGLVAASAYVRLATVRDRIRRVVLLGPSHRVRLDGLAVTSADAFGTPLGNVPIEPCARTAALDVGPFVRIDDAPHALEHSLEVQLPFLQHVLDRFELLPLAVGHCSAEHVTAVLDAVWGGDETVVVVSTDLSHHRPYGEAQTIDERTAAAVVALALEQIDDTDACGAYPLRGMLLAARRRRMTAEIVDLRSSGDTAGHRGRVVGYGAFVLS